MSLRNDSPQVQFDLFVPVVADIALRDQRETMERPFFSLAKRKRVNPIEYTSPDGDVWIKVRAVKDFGMATIWDADVLIWAASAITAMKNSRLNDMPRKIHFHPSDLLKSIGRSVGGENYERLRASLTRLQATTISTNIRSAGKKKTRQFSWIESWEEVVDERTGQTRGMTLTLSDWIYEGIVMEGGVLAIHPDYFKLTGGRERWIYRVARKHAGGHDGEGFTISLPTLFDKSGAEGNYRRFKFEMKKIADENDLPEFHLSWIEENLGKEPCLNMVRRSKLTPDHPGYQPFMPQDRRLTRLPD
jgi:plasmid replication initiation protein